MASDKTEEATPKKREDSRKKGQVAKSMDLNGAVVLMSSLMALSAFGPGMYTRLEDVTRELLVLVATPEVVNADSIGTVMMMVGRATALVVAPVAVVCMIFGTLASIGQVGLKPSPAALKPDFKKLDPLKGAKNLFGEHAIFEFVKTLVKLAVVGAIGWFAVHPRLDELAALVGMPAAPLAAELARTCLAVMQRCAVAYLCIAAVDLLWQRYRFDKNLRMDMKEVKDEFKQQGLPPEVRAQQRQRAREFAQARMMDAVPTADVVVTNPTHYSVALVYDPSSPAPRVVAKGTDHLALRIRERAREHGVPVVPDPPTARALHAAVDVGHFVPEELFAAVATILAYVYRVNGTLGASRVRT